MTAPDQILVADWGKDVQKRVAYHVNVERRSITHVEAPSLGWTLEGVVDAGHRLPGAVLVLIDVAIGLPIGLFEAMRTGIARSASANTPALLRTLPPAEWIGEARQHSEWSIRAPYIHVPPGDGSITAFANAAALYQVRLHRAIDAETRGRSPLILSGIPGTVGSGSRNVLSALRDIDASKMAVWPFDGPLELLLASGRVVVGEIYPRALYAHALLDEEPRERGLLAVAKTKPTARAAAVTRLVDREWHRRFGVALTSDLLQRARDDEDHFDAYLSAAGILRLLLEDSALEDAVLRSTLREGRPLLDAVAEGGMLGLLASQLARRQAVFAVPDGGAAPELRRSRPRTASTPSGPWVRVTRGVVEQVKKEPSARQISFSGLPAGKRGVAVHIELDCQGLPYTLSIGDTTAIWPRHQVSTADDFDALYAVLSESPDQYHPVELVNDDPAPA